MSDEARELAAARALGALPAAEADAFDRASATDRELAAACDDYRATVAALEGGLARVAAPPDLLGRIEAAVGARAAAPAAVSAMASRDRRRSVARPSRARRFAVPALAAALAAAAAVAITIGVTGGDDLGDPALRGEVAGTPEFAAVQGEARLYQPDEADGTLVLELDDVPPSPAGHHYTVWVLRDDRAMEAVGAFTPTEDGVRLELSLPGPGSYKAVDISVQEDGGSPEHSGVSLASAPLAEPA